MARSPKLKVFRTSIGFHDAYVAVPSQKAALEIWGAGKDLFSSGAAERVEDAELMREPLANPGKVIRKLRGTLAEHMAALPKDAPVPRRKATPAQPSNKESADKAERTAKQPKPKPKPRPDCSSLTRAEEKIADLEAHHESQRAELEKRQSELDRERRKLKEDQARELEKLEQQVLSARKKYDNAMQTWRAD